MAVLPAAYTRDVARVVCKDEAALRPGVDQLCQLLGVNTRSLSRFTRGSRPVYAAGDLVLKLFPPTSLAKCRLETDLLAAVEGKLPTPTPRVHAAGEHDGWGYVLMSRLPGVRLDIAWNQIPNRERYHLADHLGETIAAMHQVSPPPVENWWPDDWTAFVADRRNRYAARHRELCLPAAWADQLPGFLDDVALASGPPVLLHTEIRRPHLFAVQAHGGAWRLSGLVDFDNAIRGIREYEFVAVGIHMARGDSRFLRRVLTAYGYTRDQLDRDFRQRLLAWAILHRHSNLTTWLRKLPGPGRPTLASLADRWFTTE